MKIARGNLWNQIQFQLNNYKNRVKLDNIM